MPCSRWVLPSPESPQTNSGLYATAGASATATAAACANRLDAPMTKVSNVYFSFSRVCDGFGGATSRRPEYVGQISVTAASASASSSESSTSSESRKSAASRSLIGPNRGERGWIAPASPFWPAPAKTPPLAAPAFGPPPFRPPPFRPLPAFGPPPFKPPPPYPPL